MTHVLKHSRSLAVETASLYINDQESACGQRIAQKILFLRLLKNARARLEGSAGKQNPL
jgi:hypothetical protein